MDQEKNVQRRYVIRMGLTLLGVSSLTSGWIAKWAWGEEGKKNKTLTLIKESDPLAAALKYQLDPNKAQATLRIKRSGVEFKDQRCKNCVQYVKKGMVNVEEVGSCKIIAGGVVTASAWCMSWAKKP